MNRLGWFGDQPLARGTLRGDAWAPSLIEALDVGPADPIRWMQEQTQVLKADKHSLVGLLKLDGTLCHLKAYRPKGLMQGLGFRLGYGRGVTAFDRALALRAAKLSVPEPRACVYVKDVMFLLTEGLEASTDLKNLWLQQPGNESLQDLMSRSGDTLAAWHVAGYSHGDCKWSNFLVAADALYLVDLESVRPTKVAGGGATRDVARFVVNAEDMGLSQPHFTAFMTRYCQSVGLDKDAVVARILPQVKTLRRRHLQKYGQRGQQLLGEA